jgi:pimeloyl-ACP methyl ester carboxylesterase
VEQRIATTQLRDGTEIAYALAGDGPFLVYVPGWLTHLERSWAMPPERGFYEALARGRTLLRYDKPGCGLSGPSEREPSLELELETLEAVLHAAGAERFDLLGTSLGAPVAARWAADHPASVTRLILYGGWARGQEISAPDAQKLVLGLVARHWGLGSDVLGDIFAPGAEAGTRAAFTGYMREAASPGCRRRRWSSTATATGRRRCPRARRWPLASPGPAWRSCRAAPTFPSSATRTRSPR